MNVTKQDIITGLNNVGINKNSGDILVHASLKKFGRVESGASTVVDALIECVGEKNTILVVTEGVFDEDALVFDTRTASSICGAVTTNLMNRESAVRSLHPTNNISAYGPRAKYYCNEHELAKQPGNPKTPVGRLLLNGGQTVFLGASFYSNTMFHTAEEIADGTFFESLNSDELKELETKHSELINLPRIETSKKYMKYLTLKNVQIIDAQGVEYIKDITRYNCYQTGIQRHLEKLEAIYESRGVLSRTVVGNATITRLSAFDNAKIAVEILATQTNFIVEKD